MSAQTSAIVRSKSYSLAFMVRRALINAGDFYRRGKAAGYFAPLNNI